MNSDTTNIRLTIDISPEVTELLKRCAAALEAAERQVMQPEPVANVTFGFYGPGPRPGRKSEKPPMHPKVVPQCPTCSTVLEPGVLMNEQMHGTDVAYCPNDECPANQPHEASYDVEPIYDNAMPRALRLYVVTERPGTNDAVPNTKEFGPQAKVQYQALSGNESLWAEGVQQMYEGKKPEPEHHKCKHCAAFLVSVAAPSSWSSGWEYYCPTEGCLDNDIRPGPRPAPGSGIGYTIRRTERTAAGDQIPGNCYRTFFVWAGGMPARDNCGCNFSDCQTCGSEPAPGIKPTDFGSKKL